MQKRKLGRLGLLAPIMLILSLTSGFAAEPTAQEILDSVTSSSTFSGSGQANIEIVVKGKRGQQKKEQVTIYRSDDGRGTTKQLIVYTAPADVKGTKFLSTSTPKEGDQMWLYLPALGREKLIAGSATKGKFMGTDFTFEEIGGGTSFSKEYVPERLRDQAVDGRQCFVLRLTPKARNSKYSYVKLFVDKESRIPLLVEFYNRSQKLEKTLTSKDLRKNSKGEWQPHEITLTELASGSSTFLRVLGVSNTPVADDVFSLRYLRR
jgi:outer membrane lipoprotein-sorting protein